MTTYLSSVVSGNEESGCWTPYDFYTTEILFQTVKEVLKIKLMFALNPDHLSHIFYPYPLDQRGLAGENGKSVTISNSWPWQQMTAHRF